MKNTTEKRKCELRKLLNGSSCNPNQIMGLNLADDATVKGLRGFVKMLNEEYENGSVIVVEGKRDARALASIGFTGQLNEFNHFKGVTNFVDRHSMPRKKIILLLDMDRKGKQLTSKLLKLLQFNGTNVNMSYKRSLARICNGRIRHVEDLRAYAPQLSGVPLNRKDHFLYE